MSERRTFMRGRYFLDYKVLRLIGQGGFADIYYVKEKKTNRQYALKVERKSSQKKTLALEKKIYEKVKDSFLFPKFITSGETTNYNYIVTECLGPSLTTVRKILPDVKYTMSTGLRLGIEMLRCIADFHRYGFVHRDIKPANFLIRASRANPIVLIDFGLARNHINPETKEPFEARDNVGFVGTAKYASLNAHECHDLSRRDDLISWWYSLIEILNGGLPWGTLTDKKEIYRMKLNTDYEKLCENLPKEILSVRRCILQYSYEMEPNYNLLTSFLVLAMVKTKSTFDDYFDWEHLIAREKEHISAVSINPPAGDEPTIPINLPPPVVPGDDEYSYSGEEDDTEKRKCCEIC
ncbi:Casein kinase I [Tritrichomonas foetus]|uniref:non-specific serine/threonine protein kinase n=1 Tax=Tritrichomonas foetus TaxID=1144522 RepID=A0A1J4KID6_9EUKA|nr:Casein kinase I [Tritrichomonas foetus]|eukprot:OHT11145.1 Casein kinase I [Tritrichomonas foetus]